MNKLTKGFSLLEITLTITIIALLIAAITAGTNIKKRLELNQVIEDIANISTAVKTFESTYLAIPGDMFNAEDTFSAASTDDGNGDDDLGIAEGPDTNPNETLLFWQHLSLAGLIEGTYDGATDGIGGRMETPIKNGLYGALKATGGLMNISVSKAAGAGLFTTKEGFDYDSKYDDNDPETGSIQAADGVGETAGDCVAGTSPNLTYNLSNSGEAPCVLNFFIEQ